MSHFISCYNENRELEHFDVPKSVYNYIIQLECEIKYGRGGVQKLYPFRFDKKCSIEDWGGNTPIVPDETMEELLENGVKK